MPGRLVTDFVQPLRTVSVLGILVLSLACNKAADAEKPRDVAGQSNRITRESGGSPASVKPRGTPAKQSARSNKHTVAPAQRAEEPAAARSSAATVATPVDIPPQSSSTTYLARALATLSAGGGCAADPGRAFVVLSKTDAFLKADATSLRLATIGPGVRVNGIAAEGEWRLVRFADAVWGERAAYVRCSTLELAASNTTTDIASGAGPNVN